MTAVFISIEPRPGNRSGQTIQRHHLEGSLRASWNLAFDHLSISQAEASGEDLGPKPSPGRKAKILDNLAHNRALWHQLEENDTATLEEHTRFVIADLTEAKSVLQELQRIVPSLPSVPVKPLLHTSDFESGMFDHLRQFRSVLQPHKYDSTDEILQSLQRTVIGLAQYAYDELHL